MATTADVIEKAAATDHPPASAHDVMSGPPWPAIQVRMKPTANSFWECRADSRPVRVCETGCCYRAPLPVVVLTSLPKSSLADRDCLLHLRPRIALNASPSASSTSNIILPFGSKSFLTIRVVRRGSGQPNPIQLGLATTRDLQHLLGCRPSRHASVPASPMAGFTTQIS